MNFLSLGKRALATLALIAAAGAAHASSFAYTSTAGEPLGNGVGTRTLAEPNATFTVSYSSPHFLMLDIDQDGEHWNLQFRAPHYGDNLSALHRGIFNNAEHAAIASPRTPGLEINGPHGNCLDAYGSFRIRQMSFDENGVLQALEAAFTHRCGSATAPVLAGTLYYNARPRQYTYTRVAGNPLGTGTSKKSYGDTTDIAASGTPDALAWDVSGQRDLWHFQATPPTGRSFAKGITYPLATIADATHASMAVEWNGAPACFDVSGTLRIVNLGTSAGDGAVSGLYATYTLYCDGGTEPYKGTFRFDL